MAPPIALDATASRRRGPLRALLSRRNVIALLAGGAAKVALPGLGLLPLAALGLAARWAYGHAEQKVPFTNRMHIILVSRGRGMLL